MKLPLRPYLHYVGIDPGFSGGIAIINAAGTFVRVFDMPVTDTEKDRQREIDLAGLESVFRNIGHYPDCFAGLEFPTTRPGEGAERSERFGRGKGYLEAFLFLLRFEYARISPQLWKGRLGLPGKDHAGANATCAAMFDKLYPTRSAMIRGPRGGIIDGRLDALLIAHFLRTCGEGGISDVARKYGKGSAELIAAVFKRDGRHRRGMLPNL